MVSVYCRCWWQVLRPSAQGLMAPIWNTVVPGQPFQLSWWTDRVPSCAELFLVLVLFSPTAEKTLSASAFEWGSTNTDAAILESLPNWLKPLKNEPWASINSNALLLLFHLTMSMWCGAKYSLPCSWLRTYSANTLQHYSWIIAGSWGMGIPTNSHPVPSVKQSHSSQTFSSFRLYPQLRSHPSTYMVICLTAREGEGTARASRLWSSDERKERKWI